MRALSTIFAAALLAGDGVSGQEPPGTAPKVDFARDIQPLLKASCLKCHGGEKPKGQLRLDARAQAMKGGVSGKVIVPGDAKASRLYTLLLEADEEARMPQKAPALPKDKIDLVRAWIDQGAAWPEDSAEAKIDTHWAYVRTVPAGPPPVGNAAWIRNPIDRFILARFEKEGIAPSPEADRATLLKRLSYDLLGLPPGVDEVDAFAADPSPDAVEKLVDRLLRSPHFGERWGRHWLDRARYADSDGYEKDNPRPDAWRYRDWVIDAVNDDLPFDRFTIEQLAGDLLPGATPAQVLATAFHRQTLTNTEGGTDKEQFRVEAVLDRVETTSTVWLGLTVGCARCHNHKYDAISQQEYYRLFAFFNNGDEVTADVPVSEEATARFEKEKADYEARLRKLEAALAAAKPGIAPGLPKWEEEIRARLAEDATEAFRFHPLEVVEVRPAAEVTFKKLDDGSYLAGGADPAVDTYVIHARTSLPAITGFRVEAIADKALPKSGPGRSSGGNFVLSEFRAAVDRAGDREQARPLPLHQPSADFSQKDWHVRGAIDGDPKTGWGIAPQAGKGHHALFRTREPLRLEPDAALVLTLDQQYGSQHTIGRFRVMAMTGTRPALELADDVRKILAKPAAKRTPAEAARLLDVYALSAPATQKTAAELEELRKAEPKAPVMSVRVIGQRAKDARKSHLLHRGDFLQPRQEVEPGTLASLHALKARGAAPDRLDLAQWLVDPENPLMGRVAVNHVWAALFGQGIVRTANDFGVRGERPSHPELLDWLAAEFVRLGWSRKALLKLIVTSAAYRQSSRGRPELADRDPQNLLLARQNRFRVEGEIVRDLVLAAGGILSPKVGGPSVFPPMPADVAMLSYANNFKWTPSKGEDRYRRGMYTFFKRTAPHPNLVTFDCPDSNTTCVQRRASNTPLQALTALNNEAFAEAAQAMAKRVLGGRVGTDDDRLARAFRLCTARAPKPVELAKLGDLLRASREWYRDRAAEAKELAGAHAPAGVPPAEAAAWVATCRIVLNLDEFLTRE